MATTNYNIRIEQDLRDKAFSVLENYGLALFRYRLIIIKTAEFRMQRH